MSNSATAPVRHSPTAPLGTAGGALSAIIEFFLGTAIALLLGKLEALMEAWRNGTLPPIPEPQPRAPRPHVAPARRASRPRRHAARPRPSSVPAALAPEARHIHAAPLPAPMARPARAPITGAIPIFQFFQKSAFQDMRTHAHFVTFLQLSNAPKLGTRPPS